MKKTMCLTGAVLGLVLALPGYAYAKGWWGGGAKAKGGARSAASSARTKIDWSRGTMPGTGAKTETDDYFGSTVQVQRARQNGELSVVYIFDSESARDKLAKFEKTMFKNEQLGVAMKLFRRVSVDVAKDSIAREMVGKKLPRFVAFNAKGKRVGEVTLKGYKASPTTVVSLLAKAAKGHGKLSLNAFLKKYRSVLNSVDKLEKQKEVVADKLSRAGDSKKKLKKLRKQQAGITKAQEALVEKENEMLRAAGAVGFTRAAPVAKR